LAKKTVITQNDKRGKDVGVKIELRGVLGRGEGLRYVRGLVT